MLSGSRNTSVEKGNGSVMSRTPLWTMPRPSRRSAQVIHCRPVGYLKGDVVQAGSSLVENLTTVSHIGVQPDAEARLRLEKEHGVAGLLPGRGAGR